MVTTAADAVVVLERIMALPDTEAFERAGLKAWPGIEVDWDGSWVRRSARGYTKRANSLQGFDPDDGANAAARLDDAVAWFRQRGLQPVVRTTPLESPLLTAELDRRGWQSLGHSHLFATPLVATEPDPEGRLFDITDPAFLGAQQRLQGLGDDTVDKMRALFGAMAVPATGIVVYRKGEPVASGLMAVGDGIVVTGNVITDPNHRRQGLAGAMMRTGLAWAQRNGATIAALNVEAGNDAAQALYRGLGYTHQYDYVYRIPGTAA